MTLGLRLSTNLYKCLWLHFIMQEYMTHNMHVSLKLIMYVYYTIRSVQKKTQRL